MRNDIVVDLLRVNEMGHAELAPPFFSVGIDIDADDHVGARHLRALKHVEADAAETENDDIVAGNDLRRVHDCADASGETATDIAAGLERTLGSASCRARGGKPGKIPVA